MAMLVYRSVRDYKKNMFGIFGHKAKAHHIFLLQNILI